MLLKMRGQRIGLYAVGPYPRFFAPVLSADPGTGQEWTRSPPPTEACLECISARPRLSVQPLYLTSGALLVLCALRPLVISHVVIGHIRTSPASAALRGRRDIEHLYVNTIADLRLFSVLVTHSVGICYSGYCVRARDNQCQSLRPASRSGLLGASSCATFIFFAGRN